MSTITLNNFTGINPRTSDTGLPVNAATSAVNVKLQSGEIRSWRRPRAEYTTEQTGVKTIFRLESDLSGTAVWCEWKKDTDVCYGPLADNGEARIYYSEEGECKKTNMALATSGTTGAYPRDWLHLGVPYPYDHVNDQETKPTLSTVIPPGTPSSDLEMRSYVYTYVSNFGAIEEESAPSGAAQIQCLITGGTVNVGGMLDPLTNHYNINKIRIYRSVTGSSTMVYMLVTEIALTSHALPAGYVYADTKTVEQLGMELPSLYFTPPPSGLKGLVSMPNGFLAGFLNNQVWFSEPYLPHAWPSTYMLTVDSPIVGLGVYGQTLVVATTRQPYTITGTHPGAMTQEKQPMMQPCVSKRSIAFDQYGVIYASSYGLVGLAAGQMDVFTRLVLTSDDWKEYQPITMIGTMYNNMYLAAYKYGNKASMLVFTRGDEPALVNYDLNVAAFHVERGTGRVFYLNALDSTIYELDYDEVNLEAYEWQSKRFIYPYETSFTAMKLDADYTALDDYRAFLQEYADTVAYNEALFTANDRSLGGLNDCMLNGYLDYSSGTDVMAGYSINGSILKPLPTLPDVRYVTVTLIGDSGAIYSYSFTSVVAVRIPAKKSYSWKALLSGNIPVRSLTLSTSMKELAPNV